MGESRIGMSALIQIGDVHSADALRAVASVPHPERANGFSVAFARGLVNFFSWDPASSAADDGASVLKPNDRTGAGRWVRVSLGAPADPATILGASLIQWCRADLGVTLNGSTVAAWADQSGNGHHYAQGIAGQQPLYNATGGPNGQASMLFDGANDTLSAAGLDLAAPATTPSWFWFIFRQITWTSGDRVFSGAGGMQLLQNTGTPQLDMFDGSVANGNTAATLNTYLRGEIYFSGSVADYLKLGATSVTGASAGNTNPGAPFSIASNSAGSQFAHIEVCEFLVADALPSAGQRSSLDAYVTARYGAGLV